MHHTSIFCCDNNKPKLVYSQFVLPQTSLPCSFESKAGTIRYYIKVVIDIPYASPPQGIKYFTIIGPNIDCMDEKYLNPMVGEERRTACWLCCRRGPVTLRVTLDRTAYVCGERVRLRAELDNRTDTPRTLRIRIVQNVEYFIDKGVLGVNKTLHYTVAEHRAGHVGPYAAGRYDTGASQPALTLPVVPPTLVGVCRLVQIYYSLKACVETEKGDDLHMVFPFTVATVPFRIPNSPQQPNLDYDYCAGHVEGGQYVSPEFQLGQVYDGGGGDDEQVVLYRPVYVCVTPGVSNTAAASGSQSPIDPPTPTLPDRRAHARNVGRARGGGNSFSFTPNISAADTEPDPGDDSALVSPTTSGRGEGSGIGIGPDVLCQRRSLNTLIEVESVLSNPVPNGVLFVEEQGVIAAPLIESSASDTEAICQCEPRRCDDDETNCDKVVVATTRL